jgi:hypothetical protein
MTPELLTSILGAILSLLASYFPGFSGWYGSLDTVKKRLFMAGGLLVIAGIIAGIACAGFGSMIGITLTCDLAGGYVLLKAFLAAIAVNQATYQLTKPSAPVRKPSGAKH